MQYKFLIYISYSYALPIGIPLENEILKRGYNINWFSDREDGKLALIGKANVLQTLKEVLAYEPHVILAATDTVPDFINALKVQVFHGFNAQKRPSKKNTFSHFRIRGVFDLYCTQGPSSTMGFKLQAKRHPHFEVSETGWSKVDPLFPLSEQKENYKPTIMMASTFTERLSLAHNESVYKEIKRLSCTDKFNFKMVLHPKIPKAIVDKWKRLQNQNFTFYDTTNLIPLFKESNVLLADTTSAIQEFLLQKKPVVAFNHTFPHKYLLHVNDATLIEQTIDQALNISENLIKDIETFIAQLHPYFDGKSSQRIVDVSISFLHEDKSYLKSKPLNLMRKYKIRKRLNYFTLKSYNKPFTIQL